MHRVSTVHAILMSESMFEATFIPCSACNPKLTFGTKEYTTSRDVMHRVSTLDGHQKDDDFPFVVMQMVQMYS